MMKLSTAALRRVLWLDAASALGLALAHYALPELLSRGLGLPLVWLQLSGLLACSAGLMSGTLAVQASPAPAGVRLLASINLLWVAASVWAVWGADLPLTTLGRGWVLLQAVYVLAIAELEWAGARQASARSLAG